MRHLTPYGLIRFACLLGGLLIPEWSRATPSFEWGPVAPVPATTLTPEAGPRLTESLNAPAPLLDPRFGETRWPCIIKGGQWAKRQSQSPLPAHAQGLMPELKKQFITAGLPQELAWVAEVESTLNTHAVSRSGARGLFQFKTEAARRFGLMKAEEDFRTTPDKSARAAAQYLAQLYARFSDWTLSVAAYNAGEGCVGRLLKQHGARDYATIAAELPPETQVYVIKIMTTLALRENTQLSALPPPCNPPVSPTAN